MSISQSLDRGVKELLELASTLRVFISCVERYPHDAVAGAVAARAKAPLAEATEFCVRGVLDEFKAAASAGNLVTLLSAVWFTREFCETSASAHQLVLQYGVMDLLGLVFMNAEAHDKLIEEAVHLLRHLKGPKGLIDVVPQVLHTDPRVVAHLLWQIREDCHKNWGELADLQPALFVGVVVKSMESFPSNGCVQEAALALLSDLLGTVENRVVFVENDGWSHILLVLESPNARLHVHRRALEILCKLQRGGACGAEHHARCKLAVMKALEAFHEDEHVLQWGLWLLLEIGGLPEVLQVIASAGPTSTVGFYALEALRLVRWGQTEGAVLSIVPNAVHTLRAVVLQTAQCGAMCELALSVETLVEIGCMIASAPEETMPSDVSKASMCVIEITLDVLRQHMADSYIARRCLQMVRVSQASREGSLIRAQILEGLLGGPPPNLVQRLVETHSSEGHNALHRDVLWVHSILLGPVAIIRTIDSLSGDPSGTADAVQLLGQYYGDQEELDDQSSSARELGLKAVVNTMERWPQEAHLLTHSCYVLTAFVQHGVTGPYNLQHLQCGLQASWKIAVPLANELDDKETPSHRSKARYLRQEVIRLEIESVMAVDGQVRQGLQTEVLRVGVAAAQCRALFRDAQAGELRAADMIDCLRLALVALGVLGQAQPTVQVLREFGPTYAPLAKGAAEAVVDLCRLGMQQELRMAGFAEVARSTRECWLANGQHLNQGWLDPSSPLQFAEDWITALSAI